MGEVDIAVLHPIYRKCVDLEKEHNWNFQFKEDSGDYETMIEFTETFENNEIKLTPHHPPLAKNWDEMELCNCPDIMDFNHRIVLEYEEESKPGKKGGKLGKKGHWAESKRDEARDGRYKKSGFRVCKIWETEIKQKMWESKLFYFLADCYTNRDLEIYQYRFTSEEEFFETRVKFLD